jgi:hypothetical protein
VVSLFLLCAAPGECPGPRSFARLPTSRSWDARFPSHPQQRCCRVLKVATVTPSRSVVVWSLSVLGMRASITPTAAMLLGAESCQCHSLPALAASVLGMRASITSTAAVLLGADRSPQSLPPELSLPGAVDAWDACFSRSHSCSDAAVGDCRHCHSLSCVVCRWFLGCGFRHACSSNAVGRCTVATVTPSPRLVARRSA